MQIPQLNSLPIITLQAQLQVFPNVEISYPSCHLVSKSRKPAKVEKRWWSPWRAPLPILSQTSSPLASLSTAWLLDVSDFPFVSQLERKRGTHYLVFTMQTQLLSPFCLYLLLRFRQSHVLNSLSGMQRGNSINHFQTCPVGLLYRREFLIPIRLETYTQHYLTNPTCTVR